MQHHFSGTGNPIDSIVSMVSDVIPVRFHVELSRKGAKSRKSEFNRIRRSFRLHVPPIAVGEHIGSGGFADVFEARSYYGGATEFAIKIMRADLLTPRVTGADDAPREEMRIKDMKKRFTNESFIQWHLSQSTSTALAESVVKVYDHGEFDSSTGCRFILMELMGHTLRQFITEVDHTATDPVLLRFKTNLMVNIAQIIANVHGEGIFHRDIKPENILFCRLGESDPSRMFAGSDRHWPVEPMVKLGDFGTVRWVRSYSDKYDAIVIGSQCYMSPEQILSPRNLDARTDVYSFGVVCYEMLHGSHPKNIRTGTKLVLEKIAHTKPQWRTPPPQCEELARIIHRCMEPIESRYQTMDEVVRELKTFRARIV